MIEIKKTCGGEFLLGEDNVSRIMRSRGSDDYFDFHVIHTFFHFLNKDSVAIDAGANIGTQTVTLSKLCKKVYAFEPQRFIYHHLCGNLFLNGCMNVEAHNLALYDRETRMSLTLGTPDYIQPNDSASIGFSADSSNEESVKAITIDSLNLKQLNFIKIDTQGCDLLVLRGARETINRLKPVIVFEIEEYNGPLYGNLTGEHKHKKEDYFEFLESINYRHQKLTFYDGDYLAQPN